MTPRSSTFQETSRGERTSVVIELERRFGSEGWLKAVQNTLDDIPTLWVEKHRLPEILRYVRSELPRPFPMLFDLSATDERLRRHHDGLPLGSFTVFYHLVSFERNQSLRIKVALDSEVLSLPSSIELWPNADWYEREIFDMFGIRFDGHPFLRRLLMPSWWGVSASQGPSVARDGNRAVPTATGKAGHDPGIVAIQAGGLGLGSHLSRPRFRLRLYVHQPRPGPYRHARRPSTRDATCG
ncbi:hypothetical protein YTPLAS72_20450 [Nitrospira sp.]|nr:hypothetical protein YTPLAS72_20450 [Nitrospira sp.]